VVEKRNANKARPSRVVHCAKCTGRGGDLAKFALRGRDTSGGANMWLLGVRELLGCIAQLAAGKTELCQSAARPPNWRRSTTCQTTSNK
jgi:hypothetical protein